MKKAIGILGGMGPEATVDLMTRVIRAVQASDDSDHIPLIVHQNSQVPSRIDALIGGAGADPGPVLVQMSKDLEQAGAEALAMPCNTAHHYAPAIRNAANVPFIDMVDLACARAAAAAPGGHLGLLGSPALAKVGVYDAPLAERGMTPVHARDADAALALIQQIKASGPSPEAADALAFIALQMIEHGAQAICVACTEFSLMTPLLSAAIPITVFDSLDLLVAEIVSVSTNEVGPPSGLPAQGCVSAA